MDDDGSLGTYSLGTFKISRRLKMADWKERQQFLAGWNDKSIRRLKRCDWKDRLELSSGWSFKFGRRLKGFGWK